MSAFIRHYVSILRTLISNRSAFYHAGQHSSADQVGQHSISNRSAFYAEYVSIFLCRSAFVYWSYFLSASTLLPPFTRLGKHQVGQHSISNRSAFYVEYVSISWCRSAFAYRSYLKCFNVTTAVHPPRKTSSRSAFDIKQVSILCRIREHFMVQVSIRIPIISQVLQRYYRRLPSPENTEQVSISYRTGQHFSCLAYRFAFDDFENSTTSRRSALNR